MPGTDDGFDTPTGDHELTTSGVAGRCCPVCCLRLWELDGWLLEEPFRRLFDQLGGDVTALAAPQRLLLARVRGRACSDLDRTRRRHRAS
jgi:hypothetical protein